MPVNYIALEAPTKNIVCQKPKYKKKKEEYMSKGVPKTCSVKRRCLKCEGRFTSRNGFRLCATCRTQNNMIGDFGTYAFKSFSGKVY